MCTQYICTSESIVCSSAMAAVTHNLWWTDEYQFKSFSRFDSTQSALITYPNHYIMHTKQYCSQKTQQFHIETKQCVTLSAIYISFSINSN